MNHLFILRPLSQIRTNSIDILIGNISFYFYGPSCLIDIDQIKMCTRY